MTTKKELLNLANTLGINDTKLKNKNKDEIKQTIKEYQSYSKKNNILAQNKTVKYIYHTADIHIRPLERHTEYQTVFDNLYCTLKDKKDSVLVICGDIFHSREKLLSETIILFNNFIEKLTEVIDVVMILGNHDLYTSNDSRLDMLTGILSLKEIPNFYFLKESGVYTYHNILFYVWSLYDKKIIRINKDPTPDKIKVCLYHGPVYGCKLDNDMEYTQSNIKLSDFDNFDLTLLGDIHKKQFLKKNIAYPGSLIQQNHKEELSHGIIEWDVCTLTGTFIPIKNDYSFRTIQANEVLSIKNEVTTSFTKYTYIRLQHDYLDDTFDVNEIKRELSKFTEIKGFVKEIKQTPINITEDAVSHNKQQDIFETILKQYPEDIANELKIMHSTEKINNEVRTSSNSWKIDTLEFMNVFIYGNDQKNTIHFKDGITGILGNNAIGKSAIFNIIIYTIFGGIFKTKNYINRNIINKNANTYYIKMTIKTDENVYIIERKGKNKKRTSTESSMDEKLSFYENDKELTDTKMNTSNLIMEKLNLTTKENFILTNVLSYTNYISPLSMTPTELSTRFNQLFNLDIYAEMYAETLKKAKVNTDKMKSIDLQITTLNARTTCKEAYKEKEKLDEQLVSVKRKLEQVNDITNKVIQQEIELGNLNMKFSKKYTLQDLQDTQEQITKEPLQEKSKLQNLMSRYKGTGIVKCEDNLKDLQEQLEKLKLEPCKEVSEADYIQVISKERFEPSIFIQELQELKGKKIPDDLHMDLLEFLNEIKSKEYLTDAMILLDYNTTLSNNKITKEIEKVKCKLRYVINKQLNQIQLKEQLQEIQEYLNFQEDINKKQEITRTRNELDTKKKKLTSEMLRITAGLTKVNIEIKQLAEDFILLEKLNKEMAMYSHQEKIYKIYKDIIKNLPKKILVNTTNVIERHANAFIYKLTGLYVKFNQENENWEILIKKENMILGTEHLSGYERFIVNVILKITLDKYKYYDKADIFIIDEVLDASSMDNIINKIDDLFDILRDEYSTVLVTSHNEYLKNKINSRINISTDGICSKIIL